VLHNPSNLNQVTEQIIGAAIAVHRTFGAGLLESVYRSCLVVELRANGLRCETERPLRLVYRGVTVGNRFRVDLVVDDVVVVEVKAVEAVSPVHLAQVITYLKLTGCQIGLLINFNVPALRGGVRRLLHPDVTKSLKNGTFVDPEPPATRDAENRGG
jgi:GxxExxY protein